ncbi:SAVED domain-containing protein [Mesorhizobium sp.]|uniref:SAVED domain-containing protein n=2 Tax=unclassified Mesorhizobium TaxID=325217 RepID=UPI000FE83CFE|nr:SAVED domain-containing protein [Mesorhizobium sp.]RWJ00141.1 MAG: SAVED domain-containing protein [Mesorhizobium sp.]TIP94320.1 MAG: SAVED domain-containing protein [Mesorhizobium sp.]
MRWDTVDFVIRSAAGWFFRARNAESWIFRGAVAVLIAIHGANWAFSYSGPIWGTPGTVEIGTAGTIPDGILWGVTMVCALLMIGSAVWAWRRYSDEQERLSRKKVFVIEGRGLRDDDGSPLKAAVPDSIIGTRMDYLLDVRQRKDGLIVEPEDLLQPIGTMKTWLHQAQKGNDRSDLTTVYGGLTAVPLTFLTGVLLDDEGDVVVMDWDRTASRWRLLDGSDDGLRFQITGIEEAGSAREVVLAISASYTVKSEDLATTFTHPVVRMTLRDSQSSHWSQARQSALADQFLGILKQLDAMGVDRIHLVLAAQNSVVFNLARRYDKRNLPKLIVYQYERAQEARYPWGIEMPVAGAPAARVVHLARAGTQSHTG